ncbi:citrulline utilization hydrolase CtlX [Sanyastnella coralliicola]|uniref:citrulline utilization hydrolase CtlX n=1 Tax=Sanyastnella coralliicola TaxID=3069118 RepID=UPI0027BAD3FC|nr:arginine deiminase-related protein [Longitalea sp. SCSIO 12813]
MRQSTNNILMIRPDGFRKNEETSDNTFQQNLSIEDANEKALFEFDQLVETLRNKGVHVAVVEADGEKDTPDALFPNNWISFHNDGVVALYPMKAKNRRRERREDVIDYVGNEFGVEAREVLDFTEFEEHHKFLEGTGSLVLDRQHNKAYAAISERTDRLAVERFCEALGFEGIVFHASANGAPIYHTNVLMSIGSSYAILCSDVIEDMEERSMVIDSLKENGHDVIDISLDQMNSFAGNALEVLNEDGKKICVMSSQAKASLNEEQSQRIATHAEIIDAPIPTIETLGGGSVRCMMCEVFLPKI